MISPYAYDYDLPVFGVGLAMLLPDLARFAARGERRALYAFVMVVEVFAVLMAVKADVATTAAELPASVGCPRSRRRSSSPGARSSVRARSREPPPAAAKWPPARLRPEPASTAHASTRHNRLRPSALGRRETAMDHPITIAKVAERVIVTWRGRKVVDTLDALELKEADLPPVLYLRASTPT